MLIALRIYIYAHVYAHVCTYALTHNYYIINELNSESKFHNVNKFPSITS